ncbi:Multidrug resistance-associated protein 1 [Phytophthora fragariae]|uniref:Multidrug resistance-associated protein 1 n=1 Tax=Phytophthora fragariae TaxID=53985 RepID=A0A6G0L8G1_9STRA|nr:Multidrug resistance-associated protein 1 [Phytophthora fragariae]
MLLQSESSSKYATFLRVPAPRRQSASLLSKLFLSYADDMMRTGNARQLNPDDLLELEAESRSAVAYAHFKRHFDRHDQSIIRAIVGGYGGRFLLCGLASVLTTACVLFAPAVLHHVIDAFAAPTLELPSLALWLAAFFASRLFIALVTPHVDFQLQLMVFRLAVALRALLFEKTMRRSIQSRSDDKAVDIANIYSADIDRVIYVASEINMLWLLPIQIGVVVYMLYDVLDVAAFAGLVVIALSMLMAFFFTKKTSGSYKKLMRRKDERMKLVKEVFGAIQIVKLNAWEGKFEDKLLALRELEMKALARFVYSMCGSIFVLWASPLFVSTVSFAVYTLAMDRLLTAARVFTAIALFNALRDPLRDFPSIIQQCLQAKISLDRMSDYLALHEVDTSSVIHDYASTSADVAIALEHGTFAWNDDAAPVLTDVNFSVKKGDLVVVHGPVGSGKSSLCSALLGEMEKIEGKVSVNGKVAYYAQQPWIQNLTIRENILLGQAFDDSKYQHVLDACGLLPDLEQFPAGDATEIGQKGINLSGGQKARVSLARACYSDADVFILDSPLAAVDVVVQSAIFSQCICGLLAEKTVVLVTHNLDVIAPGAVNGKISVSGGQVAFERQDTQHGRTHFARQVSLHDEKESSKGSEFIDKSLKDSGRLVEDEEREEGRVSAAVFWQYFNAMGGLKVMVLLIVIQSLWQGCQVGSDLWLSHWTGQKGNVYDASRTEYNMSVYALLGAGSALMVLARAVTTAAAGLRASRDLFRLLAHALLYAPLRFFDANPIGRILNRFGGDVASVETDIPFATGSLLVAIFFTFFQLATAIYIVQVLVVFNIPLAYLYIKFAKFYLMPSREISRLVKVASSPVLSHISQAEEGVTTIRAFGPEYVERTISENFARNDVNARAWFSDFVVVMWFQIRMELVACGVVMAVVSCLVYLHDYLSPGLVGVAFTYALSIDSRLARLVHVWSWLEIEMTSPERIMAYASIPPEGQQSILPIEPTQPWPNAGKITFENVVFSYKQSGKPVLKGLSFDIRKNEKIGIVGRTGAGKSSLIMALFRINELVSGRILIDGVDIATMPLRTLRSNLSIIPQSPVLFKGSLRAYMDPFDEFTDAGIWSALEKVDMKTQVSALEGQLAYELSENGENFSVGERQMLCMARALLTRSRIVVMDEATASIDHATEKKLQEMIKRDFQDATVLTIAHRLGTVLDSDRIMVLSDGRVVEFDSPRSLVKGGSGVFYELAREGGYLDKLQ